MRYSRFPAGRFRFLVNSRRRSCVILVKQFKTKDYRRSHGRPNPKTRCTSSQNRRRLAGPGPTRTQGWLRPAGSRNHQKLVALPHGRESVVQCDDTAGKNIRSQAGPEIAARSRSERTSIPVGSCTCLCSLDARQSRFLIPASPGSARTHHHFRKKFTTNLMKTPTPTAQYVRTHGGHGGRKLI